MNRKIERWRGLVPDTDLATYDKGAFGNAIGMGERVALPLPELRWHHENECRHRRSAGDREDTHASQLTRSRFAALTGAPARPLPGRLSIRHRFAGSADADARPSLAQTKRREITPSGSCG